MRMVHQGITELYEYSYNHAGLKTSFTHNSKVVSKYEYDAINRLQNKRFSPAGTAQGSSQTGNWTDATTWQSGVLPLANDNVTINTGQIVTIPNGQSDSAGILNDRGTLRNFGTLNMGKYSNADLYVENFKWHIRGGLLGKNLDANNDLTNSLFSFKLNYEGGSGGYFDGNIRNQYWKSSIDGIQRAYEYSYDAASRITGATYAGKVGESYALENMSYDDNGNIKSLWRKGMTQNNTFDYIDKLGYTYGTNSNKINSVSDAVSGNLDTGDFRDGNTSGNDYDYWADGSLKKDLNKGISQIDYNYLKLPKKVTYSNGNTLVNQYDATGKKLKSISSDGVTYDFVGNTIYKNNVLYQIGIDEGRIVNGQYEYDIKDHLGNLRVSFRDSLGIAKISTKLDYDPWGLTLKGLTYTNPTLNKNNFGFGSKEKIENFGLNWIDFGARIYMPDVPHFITIDPLADAVTGCSPYAYVYNSPMSLIDPDGMMAETVDKPKKPKNNSTLLPEVTVTAKRLAPQTYIPYIQFPNSSSYSISNNRMEGYSIFKQYNLFDEWSSGSGPKNRLFLGDHPMTKDIQRSNGVQRARAYFYKKYLKAWLANNVANSINSASVTNFSASFNPVMGPIRAGTNLTEQFIGNFRLDIYTVNGGENLLFRVSDSKSRNSFYYHIQDLLGNNTPAFLQDQERVSNQVTPESNTYQVYMWTERNTFYLNPSPDK